MENDIDRQIKKLRKEFDSLPQRQKYALDSKGVKILSNIFKLECEKERREMK